MRLAVQRNPYHADWHFGMGLILDALNRYREAAQAYEQALDLNGEDAEMLVHLGVDLVRSDRCQRAIVVLQRAAEIEPNCEMAYCYRIRAFAQLGLHDQAELMFYLGRQVTDECPRCYDFLAESLSQRGDVPRAIWCWQQALRLQRTALSVYRKLASAYQQLGEYEGARRELLAYLRHRPKDTDALMQFGRLLIAMKQYSEAAERFRQVIALEPTCAEAQHHLGQLGLIIGHLDAAAHRLHVAEQLEPNRPGVQRLLAEVARRQGRMDACRHLLVQEGRRTQSSPQQVLVLARTMLDMNMADETIELLDPQLAGKALPGLTHRADHATGLIYRGVAHLIAGRLKEGMQDCRASCAWCPATRPRCATWCWLTFKPASGVAPGSGCGAPADAASGTPACASYAGASGNAGSANNGVVRREGVRLEA